MTRHVSVASAIDKNRITSSVAWVILLEIDIVDPNTRDVAYTERLAKNTEDLTYFGDVYTAANFDINITQNQNEAPNVQLQIQDQTGVVQTAMEGYAGGVFSEVRMLVVNTERLDKDPEVDERFMVTRSYIKDYVVSFELGAENPLQIQFPKHTQRKDQCAWRYKGYGCGYAGAMDKCDYTRYGPNGCVAHDNEENFRALSGLVRMNI